MSGDTYSDHLVLLVRQGFLFGITRERYKDPLTGKQNEYNILFHRDKGIFTTVESSGKKITSSRTYFEISNVIKGQPITGNKADAFIDLLIHTNFPCYNSNNGEVARIFSCDTLKYNIENIMDNLENENMTPNNPWNFFDINKVNLLKSSDNIKNYEKISLSKIKRLHTQFQDMIGYKSNVPKNPELFE